MNTPSDDYIVEALQNQSEGTGQEISHNTYEITHVSIIYMVIITPCLVFGNFGNLLVIAAVWTDKSL